MPVYLFNVNRKVANYKDKLFYWIVTRWFISTWVLAALSLVNWNPQNLHLNGFRVELKCLFFISSLWPFRKADSVEQLSSISVSVFIFDIFLDITVFVLISFLDSSLQLTPSPWLMIRISLEITDESTRATKFSCFDKSFSGGNAGPDEQSRSADGFWSNITNQIC